MGNAGGQWLLFRGQPDRSYVYWGTLFFSPGASAIRPLAPGTSEMASYVRLSASGGTLATYRVTSAGFGRLTEFSLDLGTFRRPHTLRRASPLGTPAPRRILQASRLSPRCRELLAALPRASVAAPRILAVRDPNGPRVLSLTRPCYLIAELGDLMQFDTPCKLMSYLGLTPSEYSSGERRRLGGITKAGKPWARGRMPR